ncbi:MAG: thiamine-phosphate kinase [Candidatus Pacebacteria bacterium]|nr:thiamine-phosphate kinase [Candidatus Paceibacterota bacterium]
MPVSPTPPPQPPQPPQPKNLDEFQRIARFFKPLTSAYPLAFNLTDDAAVIAPPPGLDLIITSDALVAGVHFYADDPPFQIAQKSLRVNLSDLAAKGATPLGYSLCFIAPSSIDDQWLEQFTHGLAADQNHFGLSLLGGDSVATAGPLTLAITAYGLMPSGRMVRRSGAKPGDDLWVTGTLGDGALGLLARQGIIQSEALRDRYLLPQPRLAIAQTLLAYATAAMDVSDGLIADAGHLARASGVTLTIDRDAIPLSREAARLVAETPAYWQQILTGGDDYEILFSTSRQNSVKIAKDAGVKVTRIGQVGELIGSGETVAGGLVQLTTAEGSIETPAQGGWLHG